MTPLPGTRLYDEMEKAGRIVKRDRAKYNPSPVVFRPTLMTAEQLQEKVHWAARQFYSSPSIAHRLFPSRASSFGYGLVYNLVRKSSMLRRGF